MVGQQEAQERHTKQQRKEKARLRKQERQQIQRDVWMLAEYPDHWSTALSLTPRDELVQGRGGPLEAADELISCHAHRTMTQRNPQGGSENEAQRRRGINSMATG